MWKSAISLRKVMKNFQFVLYVTFFIYAPICDFLTPINCMTECPFELPFFLFQGAYGQKHEILKF